MTWTGTDAAPIGSPFQQMPSSTAPTHSASTWLPHWQTPSKTSSHSIFKSHAAVSSTLSHCSVSANNGLFPICSVPLGQFFKGTERSFKRQLFGSFNYENDISRPVDLEVFQQAPDGHRALLDCIRYGCMETAMQIMCIYLLLRYHLNAKKSE